VNKANRYNQKSFLTAKCGKAAESLVWISPLENIPTTYRSCIGVSRQDPIQTRKPLCHTWCKAAESLVWMSPLENILTTYRRCIGVSRQDPIQTRKPLCHTWCKAAESQPLRHTWYKAAELPSLEQV
jgi:hypothetical protein